MLETVKSYLAGIIDGEGCFNIHKNSNRVSYTARLMVGMSGDGSLKVLRMLHDAYGGSLRSNGKRRDHYKEEWMWYATGKTLERVLADILPFLLIKREQAELCLELRRSSASRVHLVKGKKGIQHVPANVLEYRQALKEKVNGLNRPKEGQCLAS